MENVLRQKVARLLNENSEALEEVQGQFSFRVNLETGVYTAFSVSLYHWKETPFTFWVIDQHEFDGPNCSVINWTTREYRLTSPFIKDKFGISWGDLPIFASVTGFRPHPDDWKYLPIPDDYRVS